MFSVMLFVPAQSNQLQKWQCNIDFKGSATFANHCAIAQNKKPARKPIATKRKKNFKKKGRKPDCRQAGKTARGG